MALWPDPEQAAVQSRSTARTLKQWVAASVRDDRSNDWTETNYRSAVPNIRQSREVVRAMRSALRVSVMGYRANETQQAIQDKR